MGNQVLTIASILEGVKAELARPATKIRFSLPFGADEVQGQLVAAYAREVSSRGCNYEADEHTRAKIAKVAQWLTSPEMKPMLLLYGGVGNGKTTMTKAVASLLSSLSVVAGRLVSENGAWQTTDSEDRSIREAFDILQKMSKVTFVTAQRLAELAKSDSPEYISVRESGFLVIDDLGCEPQTVRSYGTEVTPLTDVLYARYDKMQFTIVTTNLRLQDIRTVYGERVADRFNEVFARIGYTGSSYRR